MADPIAQYQTREMLAAMRQKPKVTSFLTEMLNPPVIMHDDYRLEIDKVFGGQVAAGYVARDGGPHNVGKKGFVNIAHTAPYMYEEFGYTKKDLDTRGAGKTIYDEHSSAADEFVVEALNDLDDRFDRREEQQIAEALQTGKLAISGVGVDYDIDFGMDSGHILDISGSAPWSTAGTDILGQLQTWTRLSGDKGAPVATKLIGGKTAINGFMANTGILALLALPKNQVNIGQIDVQRLSEQRAQLVAHIVYPGVDIEIYNYDGMYTDGGTTTAKRYINDKKIVMLNPAIDTRKHYCKLENFDAEGLAKRFPSRWQTPNGRKRCITMESSPMFGLHQPDGVVVVQVIV